MTITSIIFLVVVAVVVVVVVVTVWPKGCYEQLLTKHETKERDITS